MAQRLALRFPLSVRLILPVLIAVVAGGTLLPMLAMGRPDPAGASAPSSQQPNGASIFIDPGGSAIQIGGPAETLDEVVAGVPYDPGLGSFQLDLAFDPGTLSLTISEGPFLKSTGRTTSCALTALTEQNVLYACTSSGSQSGPYGSGVLATFDVSPAPGLNLKPTLANGRLGLIDNVRGGMTLFDTEGNLIPVGQLLDALVFVSALEGDLNGDCRVDITDEQLISGHYGTFLGSLLYIFFYDIEPAPNGDFDIDIKDLQFVFGRDHHNCKTPQPTPPVTETPFIPTVPAFTRTPTTTSTAGPSRTPTETPTATQTSQVTPSLTPTGTLTPTVTRTATPRIASSSTPGTATPTTGTATPTPVETVLGGQRSATPTQPSQDIVLGNDRPRGLPGTGSGTGLSPSDWGWLITFLSIGMGAVVIVVLRNTVMGTDDR